MKKILFSLALLLVLNSYETKAVSFSSYYIWKYLSVDMEKMMTKEPEDKEAKVENKDFKETLYNTGLDATKKLYKEENMMFSPLSLVEASSMMMNGASGETLKELEDYLGECAHLNNLLKEYNSKPQKELQSANSLWINHAINKEFIELTKKNGAEVFKDVNHKKINKWVDKNTKGMIKEIADKNTDDMSAVLINALAFEGLWETPYEGEYYKEYFTDLNHNRTKVDFMSFMNEDARYLENEKAQGFIKYYASEESRDFATFPAEGSFKFMAILPKKNFNDYVGALDSKEIQNLLGSHSKFEKDDLLIEMPKFTSEYSASLVDLFKANGVKLAFNPNKADYSKMSEEEKLFINNIIQKTFIEVDKSGTRAAAATMIDMVKTAEPMKRKLNQIRLNRPFMYLILDCYNNPIFIGIQTNIK